MIDKDKIIRDLYDFNPWWRGGVIPEASLYHRRPFQGISKLIPLDQMVAVTGLRRVGKTTLLFQIIADLIDADPAIAKRICRYQFEERIVPPTEEELEEIIRTFIINVLKEDVHTGKRTYFIFDEAQYIEDWQAVLKKYYDLNKNFKFIVSGSASLFLRKAARESLAGRIFEEAVPPLSFEEYLAISKDPRACEPLGTFTLEGAARFADEKRELYIRCNEYFRPLFEGFIIRGQFPEIVGMGEAGLAFRYLKESVVSKVVEYDLPKLYGFRKTGEVGALLSALARETGNLLEYKNLASEIGVALNTVKDYVDAFADSYLLKIAFNFTKKHRESARQLKKGYIATPNLTCAIHNLAEENLRENPLFGHLIETHVFNWLNQRHSNISFWNQRGREVDFVVPIGNDLVPVEVKYKAAIRKDDLKALSQLLALEGFPFGIVITKNALDKITLEDKPVYLVPAWML